MSCCDTIRLTKVSLLDVIARVSHGSHFSSQEMYSMAGGLVCMSNINNRICHYELRGTYNSVLMLRSARERSPAANL